MNNKIYGVDVAMSNFSSPRCPESYSRHVFSTEERRTRFLAPIEGKLSELGIKYVTREADVDAD